MSSEPKQIDLQTENPRHWEAGGPTTYRCLGCLEEFTDRADLIDHIVIHGGGRL